MAKNFFCARNRFFLGQQPPWGQRICINYCSSLVSFTGALPNFVCVLKHSRVDGGSEISCRWGLSDTFVVFFIFKVQKQIFSKNDVIWKIAQIFSHFFKFLLVISSSLISIHTRNKSFKILRSSDTCDHFWNF